MADQRPPPILLRPGDRTQHANEHVRFGDGVPSEPPVNRIIDPPPQQVTAPIVLSDVKDEVELLRAGIVNVHGQLMQPNRHP
jgi:hypothetical protein